MHGYEKKLHHINKNIYVTYFCIAPTYGQLFKNEGIGLVAK